MDKIWNIKEQNPSLQKTLSDELNIHHIIAQLLINRDIVEVDEAKQFLFADIVKLHDPFLLKGMTETLERIRAAHKNNERVIVFGDYDVDGVTSSALLSKILTEMGIDVLNHIPHRMQDGYGLNHDIAQYAKDHGVSLIITVDCGMTAKEEVDTINRFGIDVVIIDHHEPSEGQVPAACAIINPKQDQCDYPFKDLASVGLVAKLIQAFKGQIHDEALQFAAIGTIADVAPLRGENRILVKAGLPSVPQTTNEGLKALLHLTKIKNKKIRPFHVGFVLGPRINAAGRMDTAHTSLDLFLTEDAKEATNLTQQLEKLNLTRQKMQRDTIQEAIDIVESDHQSQDHKVLVLSKEGWHKGVLGIVASHITERYYRPTVVISIKDGVGTASARSIHGFHLHDALENCCECLEAYGGHKGAAGLTIKEENIDPFKTMINDVASKAMTLIKLKPTISIDSEIAIKDIDLNLANTLDEMEPFGEGNPTPIFCSRRLTVKGYPQVLGKGTLKFWVQEGEHTISAVGFGMAKYKDIAMPGNTIDLAYQISIDDWNKAPTPQLQLKDIRLSE